MQLKEIMRNNQKSHKIDSVETSVVNFESSQRGFEIAWNNIQNENDLNNMTFTKIIQNYVQSMISWSFEIIEITHVISWNQVLIEIICTLKQEVNGPSIKIHVLQL